MSQTMRAIDIHNDTGPASALFINESTPKPVPKAGEALVKVQCFGINQMDLLQREGKYPVPPQAPKTLGVEFAGVIEALGGGGEEGGKGEWKEGDEVFGLAYGGAYAEFIAVNTQMLIHKPPALSFETAASIPEVYITALQTIHLLSSFQPGNSILWHAAASSVSQAGIQLSRSLSPNSAIHATASSPEKLALATSLGATHTYSYKTQNWSAELLKATDGKGVDVIVDFVGADYFQGNLDAVAKDGRVVQLGTMSGTKLKEGTDIGAFVRKRVTFRGSTLRSRDVEYQRKLRDLLAEEVVPRVLDGGLKVNVDRVVSWKEVGKAHEALEKGEVKGKVVCVVD